MTFARIAIVVAAIVVGCQPVPGPANGPPDAADANSPPKPPVFGDPCEFTYHHLLDIGCTPPYPKTGTWMDVCMTDRKHGLFPLKKLNEATTPVQARAAGVECQ